MNDKGTKILDLGEAAALTVNGFHMLRMEDEKNTAGFNYKAFYFDGALDDVSTTLRRYNRHEMDVDAYSFYMTVKELKKKIANSLK